VTEEEKLKKEKYESAHLTTNAKLSSSRGKWKPKGSNAHGPKKGQDFKKNGNYGRNGDKDFKCFHCKKQGRKRANCYKFQAWLKTRKESHQVELLICFESNLVDVPLDSWWLDSSATVHVTTAL